MVDVFLKIVNMSISASWLVLAVIVFRLIFKKAPKWIHVLLWGIVAVRLLCPFSIESALSLIPSAETISPEIMMSREPTIHTGVPAINSVVNPIITEAFAPEPIASANPLQIWIPVLAVIWGIGVGLLLAYTAISYWRLRRKVSTAVLLRDNIYQSEAVGSPFVLGIIKPKIYLPFQIDRQSLEHVVSHEQAHIRRRDHWWKPLGFLLLTIHWFNPLMWLAYVLLCRDIELACDEKVIKKLGNEQRANYSQALLACSINRRMIAACPLAFGEVGVKERVKSVLNYKKPAFWVIVVSLIACAVVAVCFLTNPSEDDTQGRMEEGYYLLIGAEGVQEIQISLPDSGGGVVNADGSFFKKGEEVYLAQLQNVTDLRGVKITALGKNGEILYALSIPESVSDAEIINIVGGDSWLLAPTGFETSLLSGAPAEGAEPQVEISDVYFTYGSKQYDLSERNGSINEITDSFQIGQYLVLEGHTGPKHNVYCVFNTLTETFEKDITGANLTWHRNDIRTAIYSFWNDVINYDGTLLGSFDLGEGEYIDALAYNDDGTEIEVGIASNTDDSRTETIPYIAAERYEFTDILGCNGYVVSESYSGWKLRTYYAAVGGQEWPVAETFGFGEAEDYVVDLDGDGITELVANVTYGGDGARRAYVYQRRGEEIYLGTFSTENLPNLNDWGVNSTWSEYDPSTSTFRLHYAQKGREEYAVLETKELSRFQFDVFRPAPPVVTLLTDKELTQFNETFYPIVYDKQGNPIGVNPLSGFFSSYYDDVRNLDFEEFMRYFPEDGSFASDAEFEALKGVDAWPFDWVETRDDMPVPIHKYQARIVDMVLKENAGITTADLDTSDVAYLADYDAFYNYTSDFGPGMFTCTRGEGIGDIIRLYEELETGTDMLTLRKVGDNYQIVAHQCIEGDNNAERVYG